MSDLSLLIQCNLNEILKVLSDKLTILKFISKIIIRFYQSIQQVPYVRHIISILLKIYSVLHVRISTCNNYIFKVVQFNTFCGCPFYNAVYLAEQATSSTALIAFRWGSVFFSLFHSQLSVIMWVNIYILIKSFISQIL